ncbi:MAG: tRNA (N(6)-L-threonylcarbamoyladenosine(37)-C(2))-methylthiotransferase MtaB [Bacillota bacterium]|nr:tRNA (N(6)-L-threonylcarbamoyladenosine(37)-C(2))-methylthiotransferase MtaB [Bacillota bacterium]
MKVAFHTLGCKVNQYESEAMAGHFRAAGYEIVDERVFADVYIINTCTVTAVADKKSRQYIRRMKKVNPDSVIAVTGCYAQISPEEVSAVDGVDIVTGTNEKHRLAEYVAEFMENRTKQIHIKGYEELDSYEDVGTVASTENRTRAYIKIQEGCNRFCSYCVIPYARGKVRSRNFEDIIDEAKKLIEAGYKEIVLTGINTALYDMESADSSAEKLYGVEKVIAALDALEGDFRIRLSSLEPAVVNAGYVKSLLKYDKLCHHLHLSAQSGSSKVLKAMNRPYDRDEYLDIVRVLREHDPYYGISTDIIVGFPGEKEADFEDSCRLVEETAFCKTHIFKYSKRPFTKAAEMKEHVAPQIKNIRSEALHKVSKKAAADFFRSCSGQEEKVLFEEIDYAKKIITGFTDNYTRVYVKYEDEASAEKMINEFVKVRLGQPFEEGMTAELI